MATEYRYSGIAWAARRSTNEEIRNYLEYAFRNNGLNVEYCFPSYDESRNSTFYFAYGVTFAVSSDRGDAFVASAVDRSINSVFGYQNIQLTGTITNGNPNWQPTTTTTVSSGGTYIVQRGDTLSSIAARFGMTWQALYSMNRDTISNPNVIRVGQTIRVSGFVPVQQPPTQIPTITPTPTPTQPQSPIPTQPQLPPPSNENDLFGSIDNFFKGTFGYAGWAVIGLGLVAVTMVIGNDSRRR